MRLVVGVTSISLEARTIQAGQTLFRQFLTAGTLKTLCEIQLSRHGYYTERTISIGNISISLIR